jgi:hypothetical protein
MVSLNPTVCWKPVKPETPIDCDSFQDETIGNQQESPPSKIELAYLAGLIDGEGSFYFTVSHEMKKDKYRRLIASFSLNNTDKSIVDKAYDICKKLKINLRYRHFSAKACKKEVWQVGTYRLANTRKLIIAVLPYLVGKRERAELMLKFIEGRIAHVKASIGLRAAYSDEEIALAEKVKTLNGRGRSSETLCGILEKTR